ncbi:2869_t:CDS:1, partial [Acaulospora colombiana]
FHHLFLRNILKPGVGLDSLSDVFTSLVAPYCYLLLVIYCRPHYASPVL